MAAEGSGSNAGPSLFFTHFTPFCWPACSLNGTHSRRWDHLHPPSPDAPWLSCGHGCCFCVCFSLFPPDCLPTLCDSSHPLLCFFLWQNPVACQYCFYDPSLWSQPLRLFSSSSSLLTTRSTAAGWAPIQRGSRGNTSGRESIMVGISFTLCTVKTSAALLKKQCSCLVGFVECVFYLIFFLFTFSLYAWSLLQRHVFLPGKSQCLFADMWSSVGSMRMISTSREQQETF